MVESAVTFPLFKSKLDYFCTKSANKEVVNILVRLRVLAGSSLVRTRSISLGLFDFKVKFVKGFILPPHFYSLLYFTFYLTSILTEARSVEVLNNECNKAPPPLVPVFVPRLLELELHFRSLILNQELNQLTRQSLSQHQKIGRVQIWEEAQF